MENDVGLVETLEGQRPHPFLEQVARIEQTGQIDEQVLDLRVRSEAENREASGLGLGAHHRQRLSHQRVEEGRFADVRPARQRDPAEPGLSHGDGVASGVPREDSGTRARTRTSG